MAVLGLHFCARAFSSCGERGPLFIAVRGPLTIAASLVAEHRLQTRRLSNCGSRAQPLRGTWDLPRPGLEPVSPALAGRLSTTAPPGKPAGGFLTTAPPGKSQNFIYEKVMTKPKVCRMGVSYSSTPHLTSQLCGLEAGERQPLSHYQSPYTNSSLFAT